ncbi:MAG: competence/damage-inducible protein A [Clostridiales bacterium]|nr:competence/damage-inducible protein A [Clostridiales bacterium]
MNAEILAVGTELLLGNIVNTNAQYISMRLAALGIPVYYQTVVGDNRRRLLEAYRLAFSRADIVIATGGLGPTADDLTKETGAEYFNRELILDENSWREIETYFKTQNYKITESNKKQAYIPQGAIIMPNANGTAPGCIIEENGKALLMLPGPPSEMVPMFEAQAVPYLRAKTSQTFFSRTLRVCGIGESAAEQVLKDIIDSQTNPSIAPYAKLGEVHFRLTACAASEAEAAALMEPAVDEIYRRLGAHIYGEDEVTLEEAVVSLLIKQQLKIAVAESCTGGMLVSRLVNVPGVSSVLNEGLVTYSNAAKIARLNIDKGTLLQYGAVSEETALEMACGAAVTAGADLGVSTTGIAGPDGGTEEKPAGLVFIGLYLRGKSSAERLIIKGSRDKVRERAVVAALDLIRRRLHDNA